MSLGYGGVAKLSSLGDDRVIYDYGGVNLNEQGMSNPDRICDGQIIISRECFIEPIIHEKVKRQPGKRKKTLVKRIVVNVDYETMIAEGKIEVVNSKYDYRLSYGEMISGSFARTLIKKILVEYQEKGVIPEYCSFFQ